MLYSHQYPGMIRSRSPAASLAIRLNGSGTSSSAGKSPLASSANEANRQKCLTLTHSPGQKPRPASISPSGERLLWLEPIVAQAAMLLWPLTSAAMRKELL